MKSGGVFFLTLKTFSATGGIEKVCKVAAKAIFEYCRSHKEDLRLWSMHDAENDARDNLYLPEELFRGFGGNKSRFVFEAVKNGKGKRIVLLSHINLLLIGWLIKKISASTRLVLITHGIEIWKPISFLKRLMLHSCDEIISVSEFTRTKLIEIHHMPASKCIVLNNCLDPYLQKQPDLSNVSALKKKYQFNQGDRILFTLTRLASTERHKRYDKVMEAMARLNNPSIKYLLAGKYSADEKSFLEEKIRSLGLEGRVVLAGYVPDPEMADHFNICDLYIMPSTKEGFGIVFIEAMFYGLPVIAGNKDGSTDALMGGKLGKLIDPDDINEMGVSISKVLNNPDSYKPDQDMLLKNFSYETYKGRINEMMKRNYE